MQDISDIHVLYVGFFTQQGAMADDYVMLGRYLAERCSLYCLMGESEKAYDVAGARDVLRLPFNRNNKAALFDVRNYIRVVRFVRENEIDIIFFKTPHPANIFISEMLKKYPQVVYCHDFKEHMGVDILTTIRTEIEKRVQARNSARVFVASQSLKQQMVQKRNYWKEEKIKVIPLGIMEDLVPGQKYEIEDIDVLFFGRIEYYKGLDILAGAVAGEDWNVYVVGKGDLKDIYGFSEFPSNVTFINRYVDDRELAELIGRSKIVVLPYRDATGTQIIPTAMYCGKSVIATDVGSFSEYIQNGADGIIVRPEDADALRAAISEVLGREQFRKELGRNAVIKAKRRFMNTEIADMYIHEFSSMLSINRNSGG